MMAGTRLLASMAAWAVCSASGRPLNEPSSLAVPLTKAATSRSIGPGMGSQATPSPSTPRNLLEGGGSVGAQPRREAGSYIVRAKSADDLEALKSELRSSGAKVESDLSQINSIADSIDSSTATALAASPRVASLGKNGVRTLIDPDGATTKDPDLPPLSRAPADPASSFSGLMWNLDRINAQKANAITMGDGVTVGVADTGLDFTHSEIASQIVGQQDFTPTEAPPICKTYFGASDADWALEFGGPATTDWNGHGSWIGGNIAAALDGVGVNGVAPKVKLFDLKISQWCGSAYDSELIAAFIYAADHGIDIVSISFGGYFDRR